MYNSVWIVYTVFRLTPSLLYLQMRGSSTMIKPLDEFATSGYITEL